MATIQKRGNSYRITVSNGYDSTGRQIRKTTTWTPAPGMTARQIEKEVTRQAVLFEEQIKTGKLAVDGGVRLSDFTQLFLEQYAKLQLKPKTVYDYENAMAVVNRYLGQYKLSDIKPGHVAALYAKLQQSGIRVHETAVPIVDFVKILKESHLTMVQLTTETKISNWSLRQCKKGQSISADSARAIAAALHADPTDLFSFKHDDRPLAPGTIHVYHRALSAVFSRAVKWGYLAANPAEKADLPSIARRKARYLDEPDARRLLELLQAEPIKWRTLLTFDLLSGLRRAELLGLRWEDVDLDGAILHIRQTWNYIPGNGCYVDTPKTPDGERTMKISRSAVQLLTQLHEWQLTQETLLGNVWHNVDNRVFTSEEGVPLFPDSVTSWFTAFVQRSGLPQVTVHSLRHTYASLMIADHIPLVVVAHSLGHAQTSTTANIYAHVISGAEAKATEVLDRFSDVIQPQTAKNKETVG